MRGEHRGVGEKERAKQGAAKQEKAPWSRDGENRKMGRNGA